MSDVTTIFSLLAADYRRRVLGLLYDTSTIRIPEDFGKRGASNESRSGRSSTTQKMASHETTREVEIQLEHNHLPKLEEEEFIEWDRDAGVVTRGPAYDEIEPVIDTLLANADAFPGELL